MPRIFVDRVLVLDMMTGGRRPGQHTDVCTLRFHVHELVDSIRKDGLSTRRFREATVVKVPQGELENFRAFNRKMCESDELLPAYSPDMRYALLTRTEM